MFCLSTPTYFLAQQYNTHNMAILPKKEQAQKRINKRRLRVKQETEFINLYAKLQDRANKLRLDQLKHPTKWEMILRTELLLRGIPHEFQYPLVVYPKYVCLDFYFPEARLAVEVDGQHHHTKGGILRDKLRTARINELGIDVIRFTNYRVEKDVGIVINMILSH